MSVELDSKTEFLIEQASFALKRNGVDTQNLTRQELFEKARALYSNQLDRYRNEFNNNGGEIRSENGTPTPILDAYRDKIADFDDMLMSLNGDGNRLIDPK